MAQAINTFYTIAKVPMRLYYDSDRAAKRITTQAGWVQEAGNYRIVNVMWTNANGDWLQTEPTSGGIALYAIRNITDSYIIGWVRDDDNVKKGEITSIPNAITTEDASFKVGFTKMPGSTYTLKMVSNGVTWGSYVNSDNSIAWDNLSQTHVFNAVNKAKIYSAMPSSTNASATVTLETTYQGKSLGTDTKTIQVSIPNSIKPSFASTPVATITGAVGGKNYVGLTSLKLVVPTITIPSGATITSTIIDIGGQRSGNLAVGGSLTRAFNTAGTVSASVTTTDSRGRSAVYSTSYAVLAHQSISIDSFTAIRNGTTGIKITANGRYMTAVDGTPKYTITKSIRGANTWTSVATGTTTVANGRYTVAVTQTSGFTASSAYDLRIVVSGTNTSATGDSVVGTEAVPMSFGKHGSGVGTMFDNSNSASLQVGSGGIDSDGPIRVNGVTQEFNKSIIGDADPSITATSGAARISAGHTSLPSGAAWSQMLTIYGGGDTISQMVFSFSGTGNPWVRSGNPPAVGGKGSYGAWKKLAFTGDIPAASTPFTKGSNTNGTWVKFSDGTIIAQRNIDLTYTHNTPIPTAFAYNMPVTMPSNSYIAVSVASQYTADSEAENDVYDNFGFLVSGKRGNQWIMKPNLFSRYGSVSYGPNGGKWFNTTAGTTYTMQLSFIAIGVV